MAADDDLPPKPAGLTEGESVTESLSERYRVYAERYVVHHNKERAAREAGLESRYANVKIHAEPAVQAYIAELHACARKRSQISADAIIRELAGIAFASIGEVAEWDRDGVRAKPSSELTEDELKTISEIGSKTTCGEGWQSTEWKVKQHDKLKALVQLARHLGLDPGDKHRFEGGDPNKPILVQGLTEEALAGIRQSFLGLAADVVDGGDSDADE